MKTRTNGLEMMLFIIWQLKLDWIPRVEHRWQRQPHQPDVHRSEISAVAEDFLLLKLLAQEHLREDVFCNVIILFTTVDTARGRVEGWFSQSPVLVLPEPVFRRNQKFGK